MKRNAFPIRFRDRHFDVVISHEAMRFAANVIDVDVRELDTGVALTEAERTEAATEHEKNRTTAVYFDAEGAIAAYEAVHELS